MPVVGVIPATTAMCRRADRKIIAAEEEYSALIGYRFHIPPAGEYIDWLEKAGFENAQMRERFLEPRLSEKIRAVGGLKNLLRISSITLRLMRKSPVLRKKMLQSGRVKRVLFQSRSTAQFIFQAIITGRKPRP